MPEYIERNAAVNNIRKAPRTLRPELMLYSTAARAIADTPTADVIEVVHSKWEINSDGYYPYCKHCNHEPKNGVMSNYCPNCGAKMDLKDET